MKGVEGEEITHLETGINISKVGNEAKKAFGNNCQGRRMVCSTVSRFLKAAGSALVMFNAVAGGWALLITLLGRPGSHCHILNSRQGTEGSRSQCHGNSMTKAVPSALWARTESVHWMCWAELGSGLSLVSLS